ncbi:MAG: peroxidase family protein [Planctomycetaceae bacterium]
MLRALFSAKRRTSRKSVLTSSAEIFEERQMLSASTSLGNPPPNVQAPPAIDGTGNNLLNPDWGSTGEQLLRLTSVDYTDGLGTPKSDGLPSAREVSNAVSAQDGLIYNDRFLTDYVWIWGQFIDHDIDLSDAANPAESFDIEVPTGDPYFDPFGTGTQTIGLTRSDYEFDSEGVRQQLNSITAFLDGSVVYGSDQERADALRTFEGGHLKTSDGNLLPFNTDGLDNAGGPSDSLFLAGDVRANENVLLTSMQTIWVREHNRIADQLAQQNPGLSDEQLYQGARRIVTAEIQAITYNEFLPALLGSQAPGRYEGYDPTVDPGIANIFSTAAYRFGHSMLSSTLQRVGSDGNEAAEGDLELKNGFFNPSEVVNYGVDSLLRGAATQLAQEVDAYVIDDIRNFLFGPPGSGGLDLASLNIQRGRDHGLPSYNQARLDLGLEAVTSFDQITSDPELAAKLEAVYGSVDNVDVWVGGLAEDHVPGSSMGELFTAVIADQFSRIRAGDRFWYQNTFSGKELQQIERTTLKDVIERNTGVRGLQENVFYSTDVFHVDLAKLPPKEVTVVEGQNRVFVLDRRSGHVLVSQSLSGLQQVVIQGDANRDEIVTYGVTQLVSQLGHGMVFHGNQGNNDQLRVWGTTRDDDIVIDETTIMANSSEVEYYGMTAMIVVGHRGNDHMRINNSLCKEVSMFGCDGDDTLIGGLMNDYLNGGNGNDRLMGMMGNDRLVGGYGRDILMGGDGNDGLYGDGGDDVLMGEAGNDWLYSGTGSHDVMDGGLGRDVINGVREPFASLFSTV